MGLTGPDLPQGEPGRFDDAWSLMSALWIPEYTVENHEKYVPLFDQGLTEVQHRFDRISQTFSDVLPPDFRASLLRAYNQLDIERLVYLHIPAWAETLGGLIDIPMFFHERFAEVVRVLSAIARDADARRTLETQASVGS